MKNVVHKYLSLYKKILPGWSGADIGHTAARDWYVALTLSAALGVGLATLGTLRFFDVSKTVNAEQESTPAQSFPTNEAMILETKKRFDARAAEFEDFSSRVPDAPDPGQKTEPMEQVETVAEPVATPEAQR